MTVHVNRPAGFTWRDDRRCRRCRTVTAHLVTTFVHYGPVTICCDCGATVNDGVLRRRRKSDELTAIQARMRWAHAPGRAACQAWMLDQLRAERSES